MFGCSVQGQHRRLMTMKWLVRSCNLQFCGLLLLASLPVCSMFIFMTAYLSSTSYLDKDLTCFASALCFWPPKTFTKWAFFNADVWNCYSRRSKGVANKSTLVQFYSSVPVSHFSVIMSQDAQYQDPENEVAKWSSAIKKY